MAIMYSVQYSCITHIVVMALISEDVRFFFLNIIYNKSIQIISLLLMFRIPNKFPWSLLKIHTSLNSSEKWK